MDYRTLEKINNVIAENISLPSKEYIIESLTEVYADISDKLKKIQATTEYNAKKIYQQTLTKIDTLALDTHKQYIVDSTSTLTTKLLNNLFVGANASNSSLDTIKDRKRIIKYMFNYETDYVDEGAQECFLHFNTDQGLEFNIEHIESIPRIIGPNRTLMFDYIYSFMPNFYLGPTSIYVNPIKFYTKIMILNIIKDCIFQVNQALNIILKYVKIPNDKSNDKSNDKPIDKSTDSIEEEYNELQDILSDKNYLELVKKVIMNLDKVMRFDTNESYIHTINIEYKDKKLDKIDYIMYADNLLNNVFLFNYQVICSYDMDLKNNHIIAFILYDIIIKIQHMLTTINLYLFEKNINIGKINQTYVEAFIEKCDELYIDNLFNNLDRGTSTIINKQNIFNTTPPAIIESLRNDIYVLSITKSIKTKKIYNFIENYVYML